MVLAPLTGEPKPASYGVLQLVRARLNVITPGEHGPGVQFADDQEFDVLYRSELASSEEGGHSLSIRADLREQVDENGVLIRSASDRPLVRFRLSGLCRKVKRRHLPFIWLFKVRAKPVTESYQTKEGGTVTRQTGEVEWVAIKRTHDGQYQAVADEAENGFTAEKGATFLQSVYEPAFTVTP